MFFLVQPLQSKMRMLIVVLCLLCIVPAVSLAQQQGVPVIVDGDQVRYLHDEGKVVAQGNVKMKYEDVTIYCDEAVYNRETHNAVIKGDMKVTSDKGVIYGTDAVYDFSAKQTQINQIRVESPPVYGGGPKAQGLSENEYVVHSGYVTTCDYDEPHWKLNARRIIMYPNEKVVAKHVVLKIGDIPVLYLPYYSHSLKDKSFPVEFSPGSSSEWGMYMLSRYRYTMNEQNRGKLHLDLYERRGWGTGFTHKVETKNWGQALINYYQIEDALYARDKRSELFDEYPERRSVAAKLLEDDRYRTDFSYDWKPMQSMSIKAEYHKFSDQYIVKDFFYREYEIESVPDTYALAQYGFANSSLSLLAKKQVNRFRTVVEYLPELEYTLFKHTLAEGLPLYFNTDISAAYVTRQYANSARDEEVARIHSKSVVSYDSQLAWLTINPHVDFYSTYYSQNKYDDREILRNAFGAGVSMSTKLYKTFSQGFTLLGQDIEKMRHVMTPILEYGYIHDPTVGNTNIIQFDSKDSLTRSEAATFKLENKLQAKSEEATWDLLYFSPSITYRINHPTGGSSFTEAKLDLEFYPVSNVSLNVDSTYDCINRNIERINADIKFRGGDEHPYSVAVGHRYARGGNSQSTLSWDYQINPTLEFHNYIRYEFKSQEFKEQQYVLRKDLHCWLMDVGINVDRDQNYTLWMMFRVKAFPDVRFGFDHTYHGGKENY